jgi:signal transduction histidine kinase
METMPKVDAPEINQVADADSGPASGRLHFRVSAGLKRVLGRELITDDEVAIFELVKNSFDAGARKVFIHFGEDEITITDNGTGMSLDDLQDKWLFVAYSAKRDGNQSQGKGGYRDQVADRQHYAGSKGIGRFSSDRLGRVLVLQTRSQSDTGGPVHTLEVDWSKFEQDDTRLFGRVGLSYRVTESFELPAGVPQVRHGTCVQVRDLQKRWTRTELLRLRAGLAKLINPFGAGVDAFEIELIVPSELKADADATARIKPGDEAPSASVNGPVRNFIFSTLRDKTTFVEVAVDPETDTIETSLTDRGELIYRIREKNPYPLLRNAGFLCQLYYLNRSAKATFGRRMGLSSVQFGSVFLFRNEFRVFPIGDPGDDWFAIDRRKQQGYNRYLGSRDIIGRIDVSGDDSLFKEASSRNQGLIETPAVQQLKVLFWEQCLKRLERYVVPVTWVDKTDSDLDTTAALQADAGRARVSAAVASLIGDDDVELLDYSKRLVNLVNERSEQFESSLTSLRAIALSTHDTELVAKIDAAEARFVILKRAEAEARRIADAERAAKVAAEKRAVDAEARAESTAKELGEERKRNLFLASISTLDVDTILNMHHQITIYAADLQQQIDNLLKRTSRVQTVPREVVIGGLEPIALLNKKVLAIAQFATKANFRLSSESIEEDLGEYVVQYIEGVARAFLVGNMRVDVHNKAVGARCLFKPIDISIVIDNMISNSRRARASLVTFEILQPRKNLLQINVVDDGQGIAPAATEGGRLFEKGFTTTSGSGLGLYHVRQVLSAMGGSIDIGQASGRGSVFVIRIPL